MALHTLSLQTSERSEMIEITARIAELVKKSGIQDGLALVSVPHTTAAVTINENADPDVQRDLLLKLSTLIPQAEAYYLHNEGNSDAHIKTSLVGNMVTVVIDAGELVLGTWQGIQFCEFDGPRTRRVQVKLINLTR